MHNRSGSTAEMIFHNQNKISCLQEKGTYQFNTPSIWHCTRYHKRRVKNVLHISIPVAQVSQNKIETMQ